MAKLTKNQKIALSKIEAGKAYSVTEGAAKVKDVNYAKFDDFSRIWRSSMRCCATFSSS